jgi:hypothetical protein
VEEAVQRMNTAEEKMHQVLAQYEKLQNIIQAEKNLRKLAEQKAKEALSQAAQAEIARRSEEKQRRLTEERAKRAVSHASKTVMHFLNAPLDDDTHEQMKKFNTE